MRYVWWNSGAFLTSFLVAFFIGFWGRVLPNTYLPSGIPIAGKNKDELHTVLEEIQNRDDVELDLNGVTYRINYNNLGFSLDYETLDSQLYSSSTTGEILRLSSSIARIFRREVVYPQFLVMKESILLPQELNKDSKLSFDSYTGRFTYLPTRRDYHVVSKSLLPQVEKVFGAESPMLSGDGELIDHEESYLDELNARVAHAAKENLILRVKDGKNYADIHLTENEIRNMLAFDLHSGNPAIDIDRAAFSSIILSKLTENQKKEFQLDVAYPDAVATINDRFQMYNVDSVILGIDDGPSTDGSLAETYAEVDISQQKMYFFRGGQMVREFRVSTGYDYPTPVGEYHILNKATKAFSNIYSVWMDYWMGFKYAGDIGAYLGIHEIAYSLDEKNNRVYRLGNYIGEPKTGGCIALSHGEAQELYEMASEGMLIKIVK